MFLCKGHKVIDMTVRIVMNPKKVSLHYFRHILIKFCMHVGAVVCEQKSGINALTLTTFYMLLLYIA